MKLELETLDFDLQTLLHEFAASPAVSAHAKGLEFCCVADPAVPTLLRGDPGRLRQILTNLAGNAVKFTGKGEVTVRVALEEETASRCRLRFSVLDTGIGIPLDKIAAVFDKFSRVEISTARNHGGTGLGLATSKRLAEMMGGELGVASEEGRGSQFWFTVSLAKQPVASPTPSHTSAGLGGVRALIVDDNATSREILTTLLASAGMRPVAVDSGPAALQELYRALTENDPFLVAIIDSRMPGMDGEAVRRAMRADARLAATRMVMLMPLGSRSVEQTAHDLAGVSCVNKPVMREELFNVLSNVMSQTTASEAPASARPSGKLAQNGRILLAEDNATNQEVALSMLTKFGLGADAVGNGAEALKALESTLYDLVLMDVRMPVMDGIEAARRIRSPESAVRDHAIPIIALTADVMRATHEHCIAAGMNDFVTKPVSPDALLKTLSKWLGPRNGHEPALAKELVPTPAVGDKPCVFNRAIVLKRMMGDEELANRVIEAFLADVPRQIQALKNLLAQGDADGSGCLAHSIKGAAASVGGEFLTKVALRMEKSADAGDLGAVNESMAELEAQFLRLRETITEEEYA